MPATETLERDIVELRKELRSIEAQEIEKRALADQVVAEIRSSGVNPLTDADAFKKVDEAYKEPDELKQRSSELRERLGRALEIVGQERKDAPSSGDEEEARNRARLSMGERFNRSEEIAALRTSGRLDSEMSRVETKPVEIATRAETRDLLRQRTTLDITAGGAAVPIDQQLSPVVKPLRAIKVLDLITMGSTDSNTVNWVLQTVRTDVAAETAYGTAAPEADYEFALKTATVKRIPQFVPATKDILADAGQLETLVNSQLMFGVRLRADGQVVNGDGTGQNLKGILNTSGILTQARSTDTHLDAVHKAITQVRLNLFDEPDSIVLHPTDYEKIVLAKDSQGNYLFKIGEPGTVWGLNAAVSPVVSAGTAIVGQFRWATMWLRAGISVAASDSHQDFFTKGMVAILAEMRAAFAVQQPVAFCTVTGM